MVNVYRISEYAVGGIQGKPRTAMQSLFDEFDSFPMDPYKDTLIAYVCGTSKKLQPVVHMLARYGIYRISDLLRYSEGEFFCQFSFRPAEREHFLRKLDRAGARFRAVGNSIQL
jgi:hypothetical protein